MQHTLKASAIAAIGSLLSGCGHIPAATIYKLMTYDVTAADPAQIRAAARYPVQLLPRRDGVKLTITVKPARAGDAETQSFVLEPATTPADLADLSPYVRRGYPVKAYRLSSADAQSVAALLNALRAERATSLKRSVSIGMSADACHKGGLPGQAILASTYLKLDAASGYITVLDDIDLRKAIDAAALAEKIPPCSAADN